MNRYFITLALFCSITHAVIVRIPEDFSTIQSGIDAKLSNGDTVLISQGTYLETLILEKEITRLVMPLMIIWKQIGLLTRIY